MRILRLIFLIFAPSSRCCVTLELLKFVQRYIENDLDIIVASDTHFSDIQTAFLDTLVTKSDDAAGVMTFLCIMHEQHLKVKNISKMHNVKTTF